MTKKPMVIARIPPGQSLELFSTLCAFFGSALDGCLISQGNGLDIAADLAMGPDTSERDVVVALRRATRKLNKGLPAAVAEDEPGDDDLVLNHMSATDTGVVFGIGGAQEVACDLAAHLLQSFIPAMEQMGAENYLSWDLLDPDTQERYSLIAVKPRGLTPHEARQRADDEAARLRALLVANGIDPDGGGA